MSTLTEQLLRNANRENARLTQEVQRLLKENQRLEKENKLLRTQAADAAKVARTEVARQQRRTRRKKEDDVDK